MSTEVELGCRCGEIRGTAKGICPESVTRVICFCEDCQAFLQHLGRPELMDDHGGTDIVQVAPAAVEFQRGQANIIGLRLHAKGLYRWHSKCCNTPLGNTMAPWLPFIGMGPEAWRGAHGSTWRSEEAARKREELFGPVQGASFTKSAKGNPPLAFAKSPLRTVLSAGSKMIGWKLRGQGWPHPFFEKRTQSPRFPVHVLSHDVREALRAQCGPGSLRVSATEAKAIE